MNHNRKWLIAVNLVLGVALIGGWVRSRLAHPPTLAENLRKTNVENQIMSGEEFDVLQGNSIEEMIALARRTVSEMPNVGSPDAKWGAKLATVMLRLSLAENLAPSQKAMMATIARNLISRAKASHRAEYEESGITWLSHCGGGQDRVLLSSYVASQDPRLRAAAEAALRRLSHETS